MTKEMELKTLANGIIKNVNALNKALKDNADDALIVELVQPRFFKREDEVEYMQLNVKIFVKLDESKPIRPKVKPKLHKPHTFNPNVN